jgi:glycosyltransferase involved in cell wall biosynthesis
MNIVLLADQIENGGGAGVMVSSYARNLTDRGHQVAVITTTREKTQENIQGENKEGIIFFRLYSNYNLFWRPYLSLHNPPVVKKVGFILKKIKPDVVHAHNIHLYLSYRSLKEAAKHAKKVFHTVHDSMSFHYSKLYPETVDAEGCIVKSYKVSPLTQLRLFKLSYNPFRNYIIRNYLKIPTKIFAVSNALKKALNDNAIGNVEVLHNGINPANWNAKSALEKEVQFVFFGGRLSAAKGGGVLVAALKKVRETLSNVFLLAIGEENEYIKKLKNQNESLIVVEGSHPNWEMKNVYARISVVAVPSLCFDWFPTVILEAMASKRPVITGCFGGGKEMVVDGETGFVINPKDEDALTAALRTLLLDPQRAVRMGEAGYERVQKEFSIEKHFKKLVEWYDEVPQS